MRLQSSPAGVSGIGRAIALDRPSFPDDRARAALFHTSDAADYVTGGLLSVDGGWQPY